jgi:2,4-diaminopentanoate dehydrogenase
VGERCGVAPVGVAATQDGDAFIDGDADCICYAANSMAREVEVVNDCVRMLTAVTNSYTNGRPGGWRDQDASPR